MSDTGNFADGRAAVLAPLALGLSMLLGGGGSPAPMLELILQLAIALLLGLWLSGATDALHRVPRQVWWIVGLVLALHLVQLVPLPPGLWRSLPGRENAVAALELVGADHTWRPWSLAPLRTLSSLLVAFSALVCLAMTSGLSGPARWRLLWAVGTVGLASLLVGAGQLSGGAGNPLRFFDPEEIFLTGFQANHNSTADVLLITLLALSALACHALDRGWVSLGGLRLALTILAADCVIVLGLFLTGSRAGLALLPLALIIQYLMFQPVGQIRWGRLLAASTGAAGIAAISIMMLRGNRAIEAVLSRFTLQGEFRPELWRDSLFALGQYWPFGAGQGNFVPVMMAVERLEVVDPSLPNRAHNDYLEFAIESGLPGLFILLAIAILLIFAALRGLRRAGIHERPQLLFALGTLGIIALHSLVDYPMRSMALAALAATAAGLLFPARSGSPTLTGESQS